MNTIFNNFLFFCYERTYEICEIMTQNKKADNEAWTAENTYIWKTNPFGILQDLTVVVNEGIHFIWKKLLYIFEDIIFMQKRS